MPYFDSELVDGVFCCYCCFNFLNSEFYKKSTNFTLLGVRGAGCHFFWPQPIAPGSPVSQLWRCPLSERLSSLARLTAQEAMSSHTALSPFYSHNALSFIGSLDLSWPSDSSVKSSDLACWDVSLTFQNQCVQTLIRPSIQALSPSPGSVTLPCSPFSGWEPWGSFWMLVFHFMS